MDPEYKAKLHHRLTSFEKNHKQWEWSDLIKWLGSLKSICEKYNSKLSEDILIPTSKRLSQCLNPSLPNGIHQETLSLYNAILLQSTPEDIYTLSTGLFPHFQYCSSENKSLYLSIIQQHYIKNPSLSLLTTGIVSSLLTGAGDKQETLLRVMDLLDSIEDKAQLHYSVWRFILKSSEFRNIGLTYMQKRTSRDYCEELIVSTLLEALDDEKVINKRLALDIIKNFFPVKEKDLTTVILMHGAFKLYKGKDYSVIRRLWQWAYPDEVSAGQREIVRNIAKEAIFLIFKENHLEILEVPLKLQQFGIDCMKIVEEVCECEDIGDDFFNEICLEFVKHAVIDKIFQANPEKFTRIIEKYKKVIWDQLLQYFNQNFLTDESVCMHFIWFIQKFLGLDDDCCIEIVKIIASFLHKSQNFSFFLDFLHDFIGSSKNSSKVSIKLKNCRKRMTKLLNSNQESELLKYVLVLSTFMKDHSEILEIMTYLKVLSSSNLVLTLKTLQLFKEKALTEEDFQLFWSSLTPADDRLKRILLDLYDSFPDQWSSGFLTQLVSKDRESFIKTFISFYQFASCEDSAKLYKITSNTRIVVKMIESLSDENPAVRHAGREWLNLSIKAPSTILDPLLKTLLHTSTLRNKGLILTYKKNFDSSPIFHTFTHLNSLLLQSQVLIQNSINSEVSGLAKDLCWEHGLSIENYFWVLVQTCFLYINTNTEFFWNEYSKVQASACEVLRILICRLPLGFYEEILDKLGETLTKNLGKNLEHSLIPVVYALVKLGFPFFHPSKLADAAALGVLAKEMTIRQHWGRIFCIAFMNLDVSVIKDSCISYLSFLFVSFCNLVKDYDDPVVTETFHCLMRVSLRANSSQKLKSMIFGNFESFLVVLTGLKKNEEVSRIFLEISEKYSQEIVGILIDFWKKHYEDTSVNCEKIIQKVKIDALLIVKHVFSLQSQKKINEIVLGNFVFSCIEQTCTTIKSQEIWKVTLRIMKSLHESKWDESVVWNLKIVQLLLSITFPATSNLKILQKLMKSLLEKIRINLIRWEKQKASPLVKVEGNTILEIVINELIFSLNMLKMIWKDKSKSLNRSVQLLSKTILEDLEKIEKNGELVSKLLSSLLFSFPTLFENLRHVLSETLKSSLLSFALKYPKSIDYWFDIISCFPKSQVWKSLNTYDKLFLKTAELKRKSLEKSLKIVCFVLLSNTRDAFQDSFRFLQKRLFQSLNFFRNNEFSFSIFCIVLKVFSLKLSNFQDLWNGIHLEFFPTMLKSLESGSLDEKFEVLQLIDTFLLTFPGFQQNMWMFLYDCPDIWKDPEAKSTDFKPAIGACLDNFNVKPRHSQIYEDLKGMTSKKLIATVDKMHSNEDLDRYCKTLINYSMLYTAVPLEPDLKSIESVLINELLNS